MQTTISDDETLEERRRKNKMNAAPVNEEDIVGCFILMRNDDPSLLESHALSPVLLTRVHYRILINSFELHISDDNESALDLSLKPKPLLPGEIVRLLFR